jgi:L-2-hydroxyglutarate oxidase LhgO
LGLSIAVEAQRRFPGIAVSVLEKERVAGTHASGRNSGVIHAGLYYQRSSMKADFALRGNKMMRTYMEKHDLPILNTGKIIVAKNEADIDNLQEIYLRAVENKARIELLDESELHDYEPLARTYKKFLWSPNTGIGSPRRLIQKMVNEFTSLGGKIVYNSKVCRIDSSRIHLESGEDYPVGTICNCRFLAAIYRLSMKIYLSVGWSIQRPIH